MMSPMRHATLPLLLSLVLATATGCSARSGDRTGGGPGTDGGTADATSGFDGGPGRDGASGDAGVYDPFDPDAACGVSVVPTERVPGSLLLVFDRSGSMSDTPSGDAPGSGDPSKWDLATSAIDDVMASVSDDLGAGLMLFPTGEGDECDVVLSSGVPQVPVAPLSTSRSAISSTLSGASPSGGVTPMFDALRAGYDYLDTLDTPGQRGVVLVTDGAENCDDGDRDAVREQAATELETNNYLTFVVGLTTSNNDLSTLAYNGGTPRNDTCLPECTTSLCNSSADCPGAADCNQPLPGFPGFCACTADADCPDPLTCESFPFIGNQCTGEPNCCHYNAAEASFEADFEAALEEIAQRFLDSCVFELPRGDDPADFDPALVNVGVTFEGEDRTVLRRSDDSTTDSWDYTSDAYESIIIQGPICDRLLMGSAVVEIVLGCPTILI